MLWVCACVCVCVRMCVCGWVGGCWRRMGWGWGSSPIWNVCKKSSRIIIYMILHKNLVLPRNQSVSIARWVPALMSPTGTRFPASAALPATPSACARHTAAWLLFCRLRAPVRVCVCVCVCVAPSHRHPLHAHATLLCGCFVVSVSVSCCVCVCVRACVRTCMCEGVHVCTCICGYRWGCMHVCCPVRTTQAKTASEILPLR